MHCDQVRKELFICSSFQYRPLLIINGKLTKKYLDNKHEKNMPINWYVLRYKPHKGEVLYASMSSEGIECYYPKYKVNPVNPRARKSRPYFPGYMFVNADLNDLGEDYFEWKIHSLGLVKFDNQPSIVPPYLINDIKQYLENPNMLKMNNDDGLKKGTKVQIIGGPFSGYKAIFDARLSGKERIKVLLELIDNRKFLLELDYKQINIK